LAFSGRFALYPLEGGRLELPGVFGGAFSRASSSATRAVKVCTCVHSARIRASFSTSVSVRRSGGTVIRP
jgi:hypothetical protein